jgi:hypothetical protein
VDIEQGVGTNENLLPAFAMFWQQRAKTGYFPHMRGAKQKVLLVSNKFGKNTFTIYHQLRIWDTEYEHNVECTTNLHA